MRERNAFEAAVIRIVPRVEREEFINAGVILFCSARRFLAARFAVDWARLEALAPGWVDRAELQEHLNHVERLCAGDPAAGALAQLSQSERFQWLVSPRSTVIQPSAVHSGFCDDPDATLEHLLDTMVRLPQASDKQG